MTNLFVCLKLKDGETLFGELKAKDDTTLTVNSPLTVKTIVLKDGEETFSLANWIPFVDDIQFRIPLSHVIYMGALSSTFVRFYGMSCMKEELMNAHRRGYDRVQEGELKSVVYKDLVKEVAQIGHDYSIKYGIDPELAKESLDVDLDNSETIDKKLH